MTTTVKAKPILFSSPMVRAIIAGRKTQTRRIVNWATVTSKYQSRGCFGVDGYDTVNDRAIERKPWRDGAHIAGHLKAPYRAGDVLWVREKWCEHMDNGAVFYAADNWPAEAGMKWKPSIHMPYTACRLWLEVTGVKIERVQDISEADAQAEGVQTERDHYGGDVPLKVHGSVAWHRYDSEACAAVSAQHSFQTLWESINGPDSWAANPWVWVYEFKRTERA